MKKEAQAQGNLALADKPQVITIAPTKQDSAVKLRVAAYARVSSASDDQLNSFASQTQHYISLISSNENWSLVDIYADEGITGTSVDKREDFKRLLADCRRGLVDRILVKSISRFARNTTECLEAIRELKALGVGVHFEKENIDTATMSGEMMTTLFASFAQAESESISSNMRWSYQKRMQRGEFITCSAPFGYHLRNGMLEIDEAEATVIRLIFDRYLSGISMADIANEITQLGFPTRAGMPYWQYSTVYYILQNERYAGHALLQKFYATDTLPFQKKRNHGQRDKYYISNSHPPIVSQEIFDAAQTLLRSRGDKSPHTPKTKYDFTLAIQCGDCGTYFKRKVSRGTTYWVCRKHHTNSSDCKMPPIEQANIEKAFLRLYYNLKHHGTPILAGMIASLQAIRNRQLLWSPDVIELNNQISQLTSQNQMLATLKQQGLIDPDLFISQSNELTQQLRAVKLEKERLLAANSDNTITQTQELMDILDAGPDFLDTFNTELFGELVDRIIVDSNEQLRFRLKNGLELTETIERTMR